ncbi:jacalin-like lectin [Kitasatospora sp. NPDC059827]|uniref:jacalin-like lectin n=1 Tax=Kitasatospora sp. NPDC059827 TaxID=3346964 RepID=UPI00364F1811
MSKSRPRNSFLRSALVAALGAATVLGGLCGATTAQAATGAATGVPSGQAAAGGGSLSVLTYNVAGLPQVVNSSSTERQSSTTAIGGRIGQYDVVNVQEDFNYHAALYAADAHPYRTATSGGAGIGSGLNTLSGLAYDTDDFERVKWNDCQLDSGDCLTPKGFSFQRTRLAEGVYVDLYNLHANAGTNPGDETARAANLAQLSGYIKTHSAGNAVVVMGDTNTRYTRADDTIGAFAADNRLTDAWVQLERGGVAPARGADPLLCDQNAPTDTCEIVDKVLYRSSALVSLTATSYANKHADFLDAAGKMLSDHDPVAVGFTWSRNPAYLASEQYGGPHGDFYDDIDRVAPGARATTVSLRAGSRVDQVGLTLADGSALTHGGTGGTASSLTLGNGEFVNSATLCQGSYNGHTRIFSASFGTNQGRTLAGGTTTADCVTRTAPDGWQLAGFQGRAGDGVDKLGFLFTRR